MLHEEKTSVIIIKKKNKCAQRRHALSLPCSRCVLCCSIIQMLSMIFCRCVNEPIIVIFCDKHCLLKAPGTAIRVCLGHEYQCKSPEISLYTEPDTPSTYQQSYLSCLTRHSECVCVCVCHYCISVTSTVYNVNRSWHYRLRQHPFLLLPSCIFSVSLGDFSTPSCQTSLAFNTPAHLHYFMVAVLWRSRKSNRTRPALLPLTTKMAEVDRLSTSVSITHTYFPPWFSWMLRIIRSPDML